MPYENRLLRPRILRRKVARPTMPLSVCRRTHVQLGSMPGPRRKSFRKRTASILVIFIGPTASAAACAWLVQRGAAAAGLRTSLLLILVGFIYNFATVSTTT